MFSFEVRGFHALFSSAAQSCMVSPRGGSAQFPLAHSVGLRDAPMESPQAKGSKARGNRRCFDNVESTVGLMERWTGCICLELSPAETHAALQFRAMCLQLSCSGQLGWPWCRARPPALRWFW